MGVTLFTFIFGRVPFHSESVITLYEKIQNDPVVFPDDVSISELLQDLLNKMLDKDPDERITLSAIKVRNCSK